MEHQYPLLGTRLKSIFIDSVFLVIMMIIAAYLLDIFPGAPDWLRVILFVVIFIIYEPFCLTFGCTLGNYLMGIRVKKFSDTNARINLLQAVVRYAIKVCLGWLSFLTIHANPSKRAIHDLASGSVMINRP